MKDELGRIIMNDFVELRSKLYSYLTNDEKEEQKTKYTNNISYSVD